MLAAEATTEIYGDKGVIVQNYGDAPSSSLPTAGRRGGVETVRAGEKDWQRLISPPTRRTATAFAAVARPAVDYLLGRRGPIATAEEGRVVIEMILAAYQSSREGRRIDL